MCAFIANDLDDLESDKLNHPERPLPSRKASPMFAAVLYFICLGAGLLTTRMFVPAQVAFLYYFTITLAISYRYVVAFLPLAKATYAAATTVLPAIILVQYREGEPKAYLVVLAIFAFILGRELCMDVVDRAGDAMSALHRIDANSTAACAFVLQGASLLLMLQSRTKLDRWTAVDLVAIVALFLVAVVGWFRFRQYDRVTEVMKMQLVLGLYLLV